MKKSFILRLFNPLLRKERQRWIDLGKNSVEFPYCACKIDEDSDIMLKPCGFHKEWVENEIKRRR